MEWYGLAFSNLLKILLRIWNYFRIILKSSGYDPKGNSQWAFFFHKRNMKNPVPRFLVPLKLIERVFGSKVLSVINLLLKRDLERPDSF